MICRGLAAAAAAMALACATPAAAQDAPVATPITIGESFTMTTQDADRQINVALPRDYENEESRYPIILFLDGGTSQDFFLALGIERWNQLWGRSQPAILVGVETVDRQRELLPPTQNAEERERYPTAGESASFRRWLGESVLPMLRARYRHDGRAIVIGESAAGHFVVETWLKQPDLFDGYAALSPSLQWDGQALAAGTSPDDDIDRPPMFLSLADEGGPTEQGALLLRGKRGQDFCFADRRESHVHHANSMQQLLPQALQFLLPTDADWLAEYGLKVDCMVEAANQ